MAPAPGLAASARGVPVEDEQDGGGESTTSRTGGARVGDELGRAGEEQRRSRTGGIWPRAGLAARESLLILPLPSAAMLDYAPSRGDGLRPATRRA